MKVMVTGGAGYIGSQFVRALCDAGERPIVFDNLSTGSRSQLPDNLTLVHADVRNADVLRAALAKHAITDVIHFAGVVSVEESVANPALYYSNNAAATAILLEACADGGVPRLIFSSTAAVYGMPDGPSVNETHTTAPQSPYGHSKLLAEEIIRAAAPTGRVSYGILRYFNVAGADPAGRGGQINANSRHLIRNAMRAAKGEIPYFEVFGDDYDTEDGTGVRDFIHVADLADMHLLTMRYLRTGGDSVILNCGYGAGFSVLSVINVVKRVTGVDFEVRRAPRRAGDVASVVANSTRAKEILGWSPRLNSLETIVEHAWRWEASRSA